MKLIARQRFYAGVQGNILTQALTDFEELPQLTEGRDLGVLKTFTHWSNLRKRNVKFHFYSPDEEDLYPLLYIVPHNSSEEGQEQVLQKSRFQEWAYQHKLCVVIPDVTHGQTPKDADCHDVNCQVNAEIREQSTSYDYLSSELDYLISENYPIIKGRQSVFGIGRGSWLSLMCALNNSKNYDSVSVLLNEQYSQNTYKFQPPISKNLVHKLQRNKSERLNILIDSLGLECRDLKQEISDILNQQGRTQKQYTLNQLDRQSIDSDDCKLKNFPGLHIWCKVEQFIKDHVQYHAASLNQEEAALPDMFSQGAQSQLESADLNHKYVDPTGGI